MHIGGPFKNAEGGIVGTLTIINVANAAEARTFINNELFHKAGVFESVRVRRWQQMQPEVVPGAKESTAQEARLQLKEDGF
ncbi:YciI family protein [Nostoc sp.]|uniref:YciI family protein n=1 Tax=Nostoc sp. TaxID=1180 RepID=UPI003FA53FE4